MFTVILLAILAIEILVGLKKGFIRSLVSLGMFILVPLLMIPFCALIDSLLSGSHYVSDAVEGIFKDYIASGKKETSSFLLQAVLSLFRTAGIEKLAIDAATAAAIRIISIIVSFILARVVIFVIEFLLRHQFAKDDGGRDRILGALFGLLKGSIAVMMILAVVTVFKYTSLCEPLMKEVYANPVLSFLEENNLFLMLLERGALL